MNVVTTTEVMGLWRSWCRPCAWVVWRKTEKAALGQARRHVCTAAGRSALGQPQAGEGE